MIELRFSRLCECLRNEDVERIAAALESIDPAAGRVFSQRVLPVMAGEAGALPQLTREECLDLSTELGPLALGNKKKWPPALRVMLCALTLHCYYAVDLYPDAEAVLIARLVEAASDLDTPVVHEVLWFLLHYANKLVNQESRLFLLIGSALCLCVMTSNLCHEVGELVYRAAESVGVKRLDELLPESAQRVMGGVWNKVLTERALFQQLGEIAATLGFDRDEPNSPSAT